MNRKNNNKLFNYAAIILLGMTLGFSLWAQTPFTIVYEGTLADTSSPVANETIKATIVISNDEGEKVFSKDAIVKTSDAGVFQFTLINLPYIFDSQRTTETAELTVIIKPDEESSWIDEDDLKVKFHLEKDFSINHKDYILIRFEGQKLNYSYENNVWNYQDLYPFGYLSSRFMISYNPELTDANKVIKLCDKLSESTAKAAPRGIKGGFAIGGYNAAYEGKDKDKDKDRDKDRDKDKDK